MFLWDTMQATQVCSQLQILCHVNNFPPRSWGLWLCNKTEKYSGRKNTLYIIHSTCRLFFCLKTATVLYLFQKTPNAQFVYLKKTKHTTCLFEKWIFLSVHSSGQTRIDFHSGSVIVLSNNVIWFWVIRMWEAIHRGL